MMSKELPILIPWYKVVVEKPIPPFWRTSFQTTNNPRGIKSRKTGNSRGRFIFDLLDKLGEIF
jgi:hypothetical protein